METKTNGGGEDGGSGKEESERNQNNGGRITLSNNSHSQKVTHACDKKGCFMKELSI